MLRAMATPDSAADILWKEYGTVFEDWDDHTLARWLAQTLGQLDGLAWRMSHPLVASYRLAAQLAHDRQVWFKRLATAPAGYTIASCCRAPALPLLTRDVKENGLVCVHCNETLMALDDLPAPLRAELEGWAGEYAPVHAVAHWDEARQKSVPDYDQAFEAAAQQAEVLLARAGFTLAPRLLDHFGAVVWEDHDECLEVRPEDLPPPAS